MSTNIKPTQICRDLRTGNVYEIRELAANGKLAGGRNTNTRAWTVISTKHLERIKHHALTFEEITGFRSALGDAISTWRRNPLTGRSYQITDLDVGDVEDEEEDI